ncbi:MAG: methionyl-tRNA formyltransferase [Deltaproteobacteria bacterium]|nr:methionyl-tRNA formyltransferase [Deltaproteobacteria bacterium]
MRIIFMGTPQFAVPSLEALIKAGHEVAAVITRPDKPKGRGKAMEPPPVKLTAEAVGIKVLQPHGIKDAAILGELKAIAPDVIAVVAYGRMLPEALLDMPPMGCINVHASLLPKYRGAAPVNWAVINGDKETGVTTMLMDKGMDTGGILMEERLPIGEDDTAEELSERLSVIGAGLLVKTVELLSEGKIKATAQSEEAASCAPILKKEDGLINWARSAAEIKNLIRGVQPWPGAHTRLNAGLVKIYRGAIVQDPDNGAYPCAAPGTVIVASSGRIVVKCGEGSLEIIELQPENKRRMSAAGFLMGYKLKPGDRLA